MVLVKNTVIVFLVFLHVAWLSTARLNPTGANVYVTLDTKESSTVSVTNGTGVKVLAAVEVNSSKASAKEVVRKSGKRSLRSDLSDEGFAAAFTADYHRPTHHPPKNNK